MSKIRVEFLYELGSPSSSSAPLRVTRDTLGQQYELTREDVQIQITVPNQVNDFLFWRPFIPGSYRALMDFGHEKEVFVYVIKVTVTLEVNVSGSTVPLQGQALQQATEVVDKARDFATQVVAEFVAWVRATTRMSDLPLSSGVPSFAGPAQAVDLDTGLPLRVAPSIRTVGQARDPSGRYQITGSDIEEILEHIHRGDETPVAETLLADAEHYARYAARDLRRAVLMAAIACEVKVKEILRTCASLSQRPLVDFVLDNQREVTVTAASGLFDKLMFTTLGRSLRKEDAKLFQDINYLYTVRNRIAHRGLMPDGGDVRRVVRAARRCFVWLESIPRSENPDNGSGSMHRGTLPRRLTERNWTVRRLPSTPSMLVTCAFGG